MFKGKIKVLLLEDNPGDVLLIAEMLKEEAAARFELSSAARLADGIKRLSEQAFDAVLLDLNLPDSSGIDTARSLKQNAPNLPIVILTALSDEAMALAALRIGMEDYLVKGQITGALLEHSLRYAIERKRVEKALRESEERFRSLVENASEIIFSLDAEGRTTYLSPSVERSIGYKPDELVGRYFRDLVLPDDLAHISESFLRTLGGERERAEFRVRAKNGEVRVIQTSSSVIVQNGEVIGLTGVAADITERKRADEALRASEERFKALVENAFEGVAIISKEGVTLYQSTNVQTMAGLMPEEAIGANFLDKVHPDDLSRAVQDMAYLVGKPGTRIYVTYRIKYPDGSYHDIESTGFNMIDNPGVGGIVVNFRDITERKKMEQALRTSEERYRMVFENSPVSIWEEDFSRVKALLDSLKNEGATDIESYFDQHPETLQQCVEMVRIVDVNRAALALHGAASKEELLAGLVNTFTPESFDTFRQEMVCLWNGGTAMTRDAVVKTLAGSLRHVTVSFSIAPGFEETLSRVLVSLADITERKKMEETLLRISKAVESSSDAIGISDAQGRHFYHNRAFSELFEYTPEELGVAGGGPVAYANKDVAREVFGAIMGGKSWSGEVEMLSKNGRKFPVLLRADAIKDEDGKIVGLVGVHTDITERKRVGDALRESEEKYRMLVENSADMVFSLDAQGKFTYVSPAAERVSGYRPDEIIGKSFADFIEPECLPDLMDRFRRTLAGATEGAEFKARFKDGTVGWIRTASRATLRDGQLVGLTGVMSDITERKKADEALRASEEKYRGIFDESIAAVYVFDDKKNFINTNQAGLDLLGYSREELLRMSIPDVDADPVVVLPAHEELLTGGRLINYEHRLRRKDGSIVSVLNNSRPLTDVQGNVVGMLSTLIDITERRKAQEALLASEIKYRNLFEHTLLGMEVVDGKTGKVVLANHSMAQMFGFKFPEDMIGTNPMDYVLPEDLEWVTNQFGQVVTDPQKYDVATIRARTKDGRIIWVTGSTTSFEYEGKPAALISLIDTTVAKEAEDKLRESEGRYRLLAENISDVIWTMDLNFNYTYVSPSILHMRGFTAEEVTGLPLQNMLTPSSARVFLEALKEEYAIERKGSADPFRSRTLELELRTKDGSLVWVETRLSFLYDPAGNRIGFMGVTRDITERKKAEESLRNSEEKLRVVFDSMMDGLVVSDSNIKIVDVNKAVLEILGVKAKGELIGRNAADVIKFKYPEAVMANLVKMLQERQPQEKVEYSVVLPGDRELEVEVSTAMMQDASGQLVGFVNAIRDITERRKAQEALRESEERYRLLADNATDVIWVVGMDMRLTYISPSVTRLLGYTVEEALARTMAESYTPDSFAAATQILSQEMVLEQTGQGDPRRSRILELELYRKDGTTVPVEANFSFLRNAAGDAVGILAMVRDITERKRAEEALLAKERYFRAITDLSSGAALVVGLDGNIVDVTGGLERISGHTREGTIGHSAKEFIHPEEMEKAGTFFEEALRNPGKTVAFESRLKNARGEWQWTESMITNLLDNRDVRGIVNHLVDITERKKAEEDIKRHAKKVEALYGVAKAISQSSIIEVMLSETLDKVCDVMGAESGCIFLLDLDDKALKLKASRGLSESMALKVSTVMLNEQGIEGLMNLTEPITDIDETQDVVDSDKIREVVTELGRKSIVVAPFLRGKDLQGLIVVFTAKERTFSRDDLGLLAAIANEIAVGINNLMLLEKTRDLSVTDELTGLYNRRHFFEMLDVEMNRAARTNRPFSLVMLDLDGFKEYNDKYGHTNGDAVLEAISQMLKSAIRKSDLAFRYGGDEFALILPTADAERAKKIMQRARSRLQKSPMKQSPVVGNHVNFSTGIAEYPGNAESADGLIFLADAALYQAKRKGGHEDKKVSELSTLSTGVLDMATQDQVYALAATVDTRDPYTYGHSQRVAEIARLIGRAIGMAEEDLAKLHAAALLHDIGKVGVPDAILTKMGKPTKEEWLVIKRHSAEGARIVSYVKELSSLVPIILHHHEWYDGTGYPDGLKGIDIPAGARITSIADAYDTMVTKRPYRKVVSPKEACEELRRFAGVQFDPALVEVWCKIVEEAETEK